MMSECRGDYPKMSSNQIGELLKSIQMQWFITKFPIKHMFVWGYSPFSVPMDRIGETF